MILKLNAIFYKIIKDPAFFIAGLLPFMLLSLSFNSILAAEVTLAWDANTESNLAGYRLYYESEIDADFFQGTDATEGDSPITIFYDELADPNNPSYTVSGLVDGMYYYFALTAFDSSGLESDYSDVIGAETAESHSLSKGMTGDSAGADTGGGGSACFFSGVMKTVTILKDFRW